MNKMRQYIDILSETSATMRTYYHVTRHSRTAKIRQQGLVLGKKPQWNNMFGAKLGDRKKIYLFSNLDSAIQLAARLEWEIHKPVDILVINHVPADIEPDPHIEAQMQPGTWWMTKTPIPPEAITQVIPLTLEMKRDFIKRRDKRS